jgi:hypothetical protein
MTTKQMKEIFDRVLTWPPERQADFVRVVELMEEHHNSDLGLTDGPTSDTWQRFTH